jgi:hypothetical protein
MYKIKGLLIAALLVTAFCRQNVYAQDENAVKRPHTCGIASVDAYMTKTFEVSDQYTELLYDIEFIRVDMTQAAADKEGITTKMKIHNGNGDPISRARALEQFNQLLARATNLNKQVQLLPGLQKQAYDDGQDANMLKKSRATKEYNTTDDAQTSVTAKIKKQLELLNKYIAALKSVKTKVVE